MLAVKALIYCRVSQDRAHGRSVEEQEAESRAVCEREGWEVAEVITDTIGASRHSKGTRSGWARTRKALERGEADVLVTWEASRAQRDLEAYVELRTLCEQTGTLWAYSGRVFDLAKGDDRFTTGIDALFAEREAAEISNRIRRSVRANAASGRPHGRRLFGYERVYDETTGQLTGQRPHPDEAPIVCRIFDEYLSGRSVFAIVKDLNDEGVRTGTGSAWSYTTAKRLLRNPAYIAKRVHQGEVVRDAVWDPLVSVEVFEQVQDRLAQYKATHTIQASKARLLTSVGRCGVCGDKIRVLGDRKVRKVYVCRSGSCVTRDETAVDAYVTDVLLRRLERVDSDELVDVDDQPAVDQRRQQIVELEARLQDATDHFVAGKLTGQTLAKIEVDIADQVRTLKKEIRQLTVPHHLQIPSGPLDGWWAEMTGERRREVVGTFLSTVTIERVGRGRRTFDPDAIKIEWRFG